MGLYYARGLVYLVVMAQQLSKEQAKLALAASGAARAVLSHAGLPGKPTALEVIGMKETDDRLAASEWYLSKKGAFFASMTVKSVRMDAPPFAVTPEEEAKIAAALAGLSKEGFAVAQHGWYDETSMMSSLGFSGPDVVPDYDVKPGRELA